MFDGYEKLSFNFTILLVKHFLKCFQRNNYCVTCPNANKKSSVEYRLKDLLSIQQINDTDRFSYYKFFCLSPYFITFYIGLSIIISVAGEGFPGCDFI